MGFGFLFDGGKRQTLFGFVAEAKAEIAGVRTICLSAGFY
jgi:hypothetical protein